MNSTMNISKKILSTVSTIIGMGTFTKNMAPANKKMIAWNIIYTVFYICIFVWTIYNLPHKEDKFGYKGYSFISQMRYCLHLYGLSAFLVLINIRVTYYRNDLLHIYKTLLGMLDELRNLNLLKEYRAYECLFTTLAVLILAAPMTLVIDLVQATRPIPICLWICLYAPGISCVVYVCNCVAMFTACANRFLIINEALEKYTYPGLSCAEVYALRKKNIRPYPLLKTLPNENINLLDKLFMLHDETCELIRMLNKICGVEFIMHFSLTSGTILSLGYTYVLDFIALSQGMPVSEANTRACDYWTIINIFGLILLTSAGEKVKENYEKTPMLLHRLINIYPDLEQYGDIYALQLSHQNANVSAASVFVINKSSLLTAVSSLATYLLILIQFSE